MVLRFVILTMAVLWCLLSVVSTSSPMLSVDAKTTLECHRREYTFKATKTDRMGRQCWDYIKAMACWGRCDSFEISDWRYPYKVSFHPVCAHENIEVRRVTLRNCDVGTDPELRNYEYLEAITCSCHPCNTSTTSCEAPRHHHHHHHYHVRIHKNGTVLSSFVPSYFK